MYHTLTHHYKKNYQRRSFAPFSYTFANTLYTTESGSQSQTHTRHHRRPRGEVERAVKTRKSEKATNSWKVVFSTSQTTFTMIVTSRRMGATRSVKTFQEPGCDRPRSAVRESNRKQKLRSKWSVMFGLCRINSPARRCSSRRRSFTIQDGCPHRKVKEALQNSSIITRTGFLEGIVAVFYRRDQCIRLRVTYGAHC